LKITLKKVQHIIVLTIMPLRRHWFGYGTSIGVEFILHEHSLADLLANPSFCKCLWSVDGLVGEVCGKPEPRNGCGDWDCNREIWLEGYETHSPNAFQILQQQGDKECLTYIKSTQL